MEYIFNSELPGGSPIQVEAEITPLTPAHTNCLPEDACPAEGGDAEISAVYAMAEQPGGQSCFLTELDLEGLYILRALKHADGTITQKPVHFLDWLEDEAYDRWAGEQ